jgi:hypothetical protein
VAAVLKSIDEIAFHTNILALNAAVEAARAGEAGAGFSVVADEVRSLAQRAADAARSSGEIIEKTVADVEKGVQLVSLAHGAFNEVYTTISGTSKVVSQIAVSSQEQARGVGNIGQAITRNGIGDPEQRGQRARNRHGRRRDDRADGNHSQASGRTGGRGGTTAALKAAPFYKKW